MLSDTPEVLFSSYQILKGTATVDTLEIFQSYETYTTRGDSSFNSLESDNLSYLYVGGARYLLAIGNDFHAKFYRLSISGHEIFLRELGITVIHI